LDIILQTGTEQGWKKTRFFGIFLGF